ncbi:MAG TPA: protein translocase subunit SecD [Vicinamibacterales bacterium]|nr:protein translocase subunit SecD [Vicinamibacterales bacterium]
MAKNLRWKVLAIVAVLGLAVFAFYPPDQKVKLGLDLKGGVQLVLRVQTDDALRLETQTTADRLAEQLKTNNIPVGAITVDSATSFTVSGIPPNRDADFRNQLIDVETNYERGAGTGGAYTFTLRPNIVVQLREDTVNQALQTIERRVNELGVAEPVIARHTAADQIMVQLPGVTEVNRAKEIIRSTAQLELKQVEQGPFSDEAAARAALGGNIPPDLQVLPGTIEAAPGQPASTGYYVVRRVPAVTGRDLRNARPTLDENNRPAVSFSLNQEGARKFGAFTQANIGRQLGIVLDNRVQSAPVIQSRIDDEGRITGNFTNQETQDLSLKLRSGALPANLTYLEERTVGPSLGADSIRAGVLSAAGGLLLVTLFMLTYYKAAGINALVSIAANLIILLGLMAYAGATMTLPGIAGFILTIGMGVDSNVLIFERIKEELRTAKGVKQAVAAGFDRVLLTILDTHVASLIAAAFLFNFGTSSIRGFALTLTIGLLSNVFTAYFISRTMFEATLTGRSVAKLSI